MKNVVIGMSGGVDSSVAAYLLLEQGFNVTGLFMINWKDRTGTLQGNCSWEDDLKMAQLVARNLGIKLETVDLSEQYKTRVADYLFDEYAKGRTPNPDVLCNREIKFDAFLKAAESLGAEYIATGHYARIKNLYVHGKNEYALLQGLDNNKDQSYFLCGLNQNQLSKSIFPLGEIDKILVREIAHKLRLASSDKKDSQGICFIGKVDLPDFLAQRLEPRSGDVLEVIQPNHFAFPEIGINPSDEELENASKAYDFSEFDTKKIATHIGSHFYTVGQRKGLNIGGTPKPLFVIGIDTNQNIIYTGQGKDHPLLHRIALKINQDETHWIRQSQELKIGESARYGVRIRYRQTLKNARLFVRQSGTYIVFDEPMQSITPGQFAVWHFEDEVIGSGPIAR